MLPYLCNPITFRIPIILKPDLLFVQIAWTVKWPVVMRNQLGTRRGRGICVTLQSKAIFSTVAVLADLTQNLGRISAAFCQQCFSAAVCFTRIPDTHMLEILQYKRKTDGFRTFSCFVPHIWNSLLQDHRHCSTLSSFKAKLKTFLFSQYFCPN